MANKKEELTFTWRTTPLLIFFFILFLLKVGIGDTTVQHWSWWWVTAPLWVPAAIILLCGAVGAAILALANWLEK